MCVHVCVCGFFFFFSFAVIVFLCEQHVIHVTIRSCLAGRLASQKL